MPLRMDPQSPVIPIRGLLLALVLLGAARPADAEVYRWVDAAGQTHVVDSFDKVPRRYRGQVRDVSRDPGGRGSFNVIEGLYDRPAPAGEGAQGEPAPGAMADRIANAALPFVRGDN